MTETRDEGSEASSDAESDAAEDHESGNNRSPEQVAAEIAQRALEEGGLPAPSKGSPGDEPPSGEEFDGEDGLGLDDDELLIVPMRGTVLFPDMLAPLTVGRPRSLEAVQEAARAQRPIGLLLQKDPSVDEPTPEDMHRVGTIANVLRMVNAPDGFHVICQATDQRFEVEEFTRTDEVFAVRYQTIEDPEEISARAEALGLEMKKLASEALDLLPNAPADLGSTLDEIESPALLASMVGTLVDATPQEKQELLEIRQLEARLDATLTVLNKRLEVLRLSKEISQQTKGEMEKKQREFFLRQQLETIRKELGEEDDAKGLDELRSALEDAEMPEEAHEQAMKELARLERIPEASAEYSMVRTYLELLSELPWNVTTEDSLDITEARKILDEDHYGLEEIKNRILEHLAVRKLNPEGKSPVLCFVGPPGVGKTSLGRSIARAMDREFVRISLGGVHDESEIRGHRRTYVGAMPGRIIQSLRKAGTNNPVFMLDEIDKLGRASVQGDPSSALLEVLDPAQNHTFRDHYLGVPYDLSDVMFIGTANVLDQIQGPLRDRCEVIELSGYTEREKLQIAKRYLVERQREQAGLTEEQLEITDDALLELIRHYTREAGVRNLERSIGSLCRHLAVRVAEKSVEHMTIDKEQVSDVLGPRKVDREVAARTSVTGVSTGLAWTPTGGDILFVEATATRGKGKLILTGQLGDVMKESAQAALTLVKSRGDELGVAPEIFDERDIHIHVPAGAIPKDGPSAGVAIYVALTSLATGRKVRSDVAMTGEISLRGLVLPVGGIKEKVLAALNAGLSKVLLPARNKRHLEEVPDDTKAELEFVFLESVDDALEHALEDADESSNGDAEENE